MTCLRKPNSCRILPPSEVPKRCVPCRSVMVLNISRTKSEQQAHDLLMLNISEHYDRAYGGKDY